MVQYFIEKKKRKTPIGGKRPRTVVHSFKLPIKVNNIKPEK